MQQDITRVAEEIHMYRAGLVAGMAAYQRGDVDHEAPLAGPSALVRAYVAGYADADDDSDEARPSGPALDDPRGATDANCIDELELRAVAATVYAELERVGAEVSAWPDYARGTMFVEDSLTSEQHDAAELLAILRGLTNGAGTTAMWDATRPLSAVRL